MLKFLTFGLIIVLGITEARADSHPTVLELFTSQGCSSCPYADSYMRRYAYIDHDLLPLSFHIDYWDHLGWKDPYSSHQWTERQDGYDLILDSHRFTPQMIVNGKVLLDGSDTININKTIIAAKKMPVIYEVKISPYSDALTVKVTPEKTVFSALNVVEIRFDPYVKTTVNAGENEGRTLESINNVTSIKRIGAVLPGETKSFALDKLESGGITVIVQNEGDRAILGADSYLKK